MKTSLSMRNLLQRPNASLLALSALLISLVLNVMFAKTFFQNKSLPNDLTKSELKTLKPSTEATRTLQGLTKVEAPQDESSVVVLKKEELQTITDNLENILFQLSDNRQQIDRLGIALLGYEVNDAVLAAKDIQKQEQRQRAQERSARRKERLFLHLPTNERATAQHQLWLEENQEEMKVLSAELDRQLEQHERERAERTR